MLNKLITVLVVTAVIGRSATLFAQAGVKPANVGEGTLMLKGKSYPLKIQAYSAHDGTEAPLFGALQVKVVGLPFASCIFVELYEYTPNDFTVEVYWRNDTTKDPYQIAIPGCPSPCSLTQFQTALSGTIVNSYADWQTDCQQ